MASSSRSHTRLRKRPTGAAETNPVQAVAIPEYYHLNKGETGAPHRLNASLVYELPFGGGKRWLNDGSVLSHIAGGWQVNTSSACVRPAGHRDVERRVLNAPGTTCSLPTK